MRKQLFIFLAFVPLLAQSQDIYNPESNVGKRLQFPPFKAWVGDSATSNKTIKAKTVFVNFWFEECAPCKAEFGALNELYQTMKDSANFAFISFTFESPGTIKSVRDQYKLNFPIASISKDDCNRMINGSGYPTNIIVGKDQKIRYFRNGGSTNKEQAHEYIMNRLYPLLLKEL